MGKVTYKNIQFDSDLEVEYYQELEKKQACGEVVDFIYHPHQIINLVGKRSYTPDFIVNYGNKIEIVETKGYNPYSKMIDDAIHAAMQTKSEDWLMNYLVDEGFYRFQLIQNNVRIYYRKIKKIKSYGFVDWDFKNPNTIANKRKEKINDLNVEIKELKDFKKNADRFFTYWLKIKNNGKLTKQQQEWYTNYISELEVKYGKEQL